MSAQSNSSKSGQPERASPGLQVEAGAAGEPLRKCVAVAMKHYFEALDGHACTDLYDFVIGEVEAPLLEAVLEYTGRNQTKAAQMLGINRATLRKKLKHHGLE